MFKVTVEGKNRDELLKALADVMTMLGASGHAVYQDQPSGDVVDQPAEKPKRGRPKKVEETVQEPDPITNPLQEVLAQPAQPVFDDPFASAPEPPKEAAKTYTAEQVKAALMEYAKHRTGDASQEDGAKRVYALIQQFGYKMVKDIKPEHYPAIMAGTGLA